MWVLQCWCLHYTWMCDGWVGLGKEKWTHVHLCPAYAEQVAVVPTATASIAVAAPIDHSYLPGVANVNDMLCASCLELTTENCSQ